jgi:hypothetical protein
LSLLCCFIVVVFLVCKKRRKKSSYLKLNFDEKWVAMGRLKIRTSTCDIERMQVFCAQMHVFTPSGVGANVNTKKCSFFHQTAL